MLERALEGSPFKPRGGFGWIGGPIWPQWEEQTQARFNRSGRPVDLEPLPVPPEETVDIAGAYWIGMVHRHFGHVLQDFCTRVLPSLHENPAATLIFATRSDEPAASLLELPSWFRDILSWFGASPDRIRLVQRPSLFRRLEVAPQAEQLNVPPTEEYLDYLDRLVTAKSASIVQSKILYVSRGGQIIRFPGERYIEEMLKSAGICVIRPEEISIYEQMSYYLGAERIIFAEGSAIHGLQMLGRGLGDVDILCRCNGGQLGKWLLEPRTRSLAYHSHIVGVIGPLRPKGKTFTVKDIPIIDTDAFLEFFESRGIRVRGLWDEAAWRSTAEDDIKDWLRWAAGRRHLARPAQRDHVCSCLEAVGFGNLSQLLPVLAHEAEGSSDRSN